MRVIDAPTDGTDCTQIILDQIAAAPDGSVIRFPSGRYRCDFPIRLEGRKNLIIEGPSPTDPAVFWTDLKVTKALHPQVFLGTNSQRQHWVLSNCQAMQLRNLRVEGANTFVDAYGYTKIQAPYEAEHAFFLPGSDGVLIEDCSAERPYGDGVFLGAGGTHASGPKNVTVRRFNVNLCGRTGVGMTRCSEVLLDGVTVAHTGTGGLSMEPNGPNEYAHHIEIRNCDISARLPMIPAQGWRHIDDVWIHHNTMRWSQQASSWPLIVCEPLETTAGERNDNWLIEDNTLLYYGTGGAFKFKEAVNITIRRNRLPSLGKFRAAVQLIDCAGVIDISDNDFGQCLSLYELVGSTPQPVHSGNVWASGTQTDVEGT